MAFFGAETSGGIGKVKQQTQNGGQKWRENTKMAVFDRTKPNFDVLSVNYA